MLKPIVLFVVFIQVGLFNFIDGVFIQNNECERVVNETIHRNAYIDNTPERYAIIILLFFTYV